MHMATCTGCKFSGDCAEAQAFRDRVKGLRIRSVKFACPKREDRYRPGQAVIFTTFVLDDDQDIGGKRVEVNYDGYAIKQQGGKVLGFIKPGALSHDDYPFEPKSNGYVKIPLGRVRPDPSRPDADATPCGWCAAVIGLGAECLEPPLGPMASRCMAKAQPSTKEARP